MGKLPAKQERVAKWDNAKALLIFTVVLGHSMSEFLSCGPAMKWLELWIYCFHMPLFIFIGGLFSKKAINTSPFRYEKVVSFFLLSFAMKLVAYLVKLVCTGKATLSILSENGVAWYIFVMGVHLMIAHFLRNCDQKKVLITSFVLAILIGYVNEFGNELVLSRTFVFFPIFYLGYMLDGDRVLEIVNKRWVRILSAVFLVVFIAGLYFVIDRAYPLRRLLTGNNPYYEFGGIHHLLGGAYRLITYIIVFAVSFAVLSVIPNKRLPLVSWCGTKTLQVYALHRPVQQIMGYLFLTDLLKDSLPRVILPILIVMSLGLTLLLSLKPFEYILYPCTNWQKFFAPILKWYKKKDNAQ